MIQKGLINNLKKMIMENFKNIILLLNNTETRDLGATLVVGQGLEKKVLALYERKRKAKRSLKLFARLRKNQSAASVKKMLCKAKIDALRQGCIMKIIISIRDAMHDKEVFELVEKGLMKEEDRLPF